MGRTLKRVPLNFDWPIEQIWKGYINPYKSTNCTACDGEGYNPQTKALAESWYDFAHRGYGSYDCWCYNLEQEDVQTLVDANRLWDFTRVARNDEQRKAIEEKGGGWLPYNNGYVPTAQEVNAWARRGMGHDAINRWVCVEAKAKRLGFYGECKYCKGSGDIFPSEEIRKLHDDWEKSEPPTGEGYQLWNTTTEGHPMSPIFETLEALSQWCAENANVFSDYTASAEKWLEMLSADNVHHQSGNMVFI